jgi:hypothetical protein
MEISLLQAFALGIIAFIAGLDMFNGLTHMHRPVVLGPLVGLVLGDLHTGILTGGTLELVWMGLAPLAGAQPPNVIIGTIVGTAFAITTGVKPDVAVGVAVPFAVAVQMGITFLFSVMSGVMSRCDRMAENADTRGIERVNYLALLALGTHNEDEARLNRRMCEVAERIIVVTDSSKFNRSSLHKIIDTQRIDMIIVDEGIPADSLEGLRKAGVEVILVGE